MNVYRTTMWNITECIMLLMVNVRRTRLRRLRRVRHCSGLLRCVVERSL